ncbi:MAG: hypothetical protein IAE77_16340 [Prosthecobacter sp.]|jgi:hypothetical protein|uniref:hypothetical protein n=1 Tax=Prosthecobacter sp. TaxID=1965333 RepID=UPI0019FC0DE2|nr:hypothetical protein [Prosthecobacter sp.]MBE2285032.1 hypothetical protein [Prosthecobacter sp.]
MRERSLPLPLVVFLHHRALTFAVEPDFGFGVGFEGGIEEGGSQREDDAVKTGILLKAFAGQCEFAKGTVLGFVEDEFLFVAGRWGGIDAKARLRVTAKADAAKPSAPP